MNRSLPVRTLFQFLAATVLILVASTAIAQMKPNQFTNEWKKADSLLDQAGLPQSALKIVNEIYAAAKRQDNDAQLIKALLYKMAINDQLSDEGKYDNIQLLETEIKEAKEPARSILHSIAGGSYRHYLQLNRWQFYNRTRTPSNNSDDIATWDIAKLHERINSHFNLSIHHSSLLQNTKLDQYNAILLKGNVRKLRPTLYDLLAHRALDYFRNDERYISRPAYAFSINDVAAFTDVKSFVSHRFQTNDSTSQHYQALRLYQELLRFHMNDRDKAALIDADIHRLKFAHIYGVHTGKDSLFKNALETLIKNFPGESISADAMYELAMWYWSQGIRYDPLRDSAQRFYVVEAKKWCERAMSAKEQSEGKSKAAELLKSILEPSITAVAEQVNLPGEPFRILLSYKNTRSVYFRLIKVNNETRQSFLRSSWEDSSWNKMLSQQPVRDFNYSLPETKDHQVHRTEAKIDALPAGEYALLLSNDKSFPRSKGTLSLVFFHVSNISYVNAGDDYFTVHRKTGRPLSGAKVTVWANVYDYAKRRDVLRNEGEYTADDNGYFEVKKPIEKNRVFSYRVDIRHGKDRLFTDNHAGYSYEYPEENRNSQTFLFTDRSLYRPGQIVFFKGIRVKTTKKTTTVEPAVKSDIRLYDANGQIIDSLSLTTNEFGSYNGRFTIPTGLLPGAYRLRDHNTSSEIHFNVEEYKRPRFFVEINQPAGTYRLGDTINVKLKANSYSGVNLNAANVTYRVVRIAEIPFWSYARMFSPRIWPPYPSHEAEIAHGSTVTDAEGNATISFEAIPDPSIPEKQQPVFHYRVYADVTDITGEVRSANTSVSVAWQALKILLTIPEMQHPDSLRKIGLATSNTADSFESATVKLTVSRLAAPTRLFRERYWLQPDQFIINREEYYRLFPQDQYSDEADMTKWKKEKKLSEITVTSNRTGFAEIPSAPHENGWYIIEAVSKDKYGKEVTTQAYTLLSDDTAMGPIVRVNILTSPDTVRAGGKVTYNLVTNIDDVYVITEIINGNDTTRKIQLNPGSEEIEAARNNQSGVSIKTAVVSNNRVYTQTRNISLEADTAMKIDILSHRDKGAPGSGEKWKVKISGTKGQKLAAELLTAMYDASLDQFYPHQWSPVTRPGNVPDFRNWSGENNFSQVHSIMKHIPRPASKIFEKVYDQLRTAEGSGFGVVNQTILSETKSVLYGNRQAKLENVAVADQSVPAPSAVENRQQADSTEAGGSGNTNAPTVQLRKNFNETAFFFPDLKTDENGNIEFSFTSPEAVTTWKWMMFAHTTSFNTASDERTFITQKDLMVQPNIPRFVREGDKLEVSAKLSNLSDKLLSGSARLELIDPLTNKSVDKLFANNAPSKDFTLNAKQNTAISFSVEVPAGYEKPLTWRIVASTGNGSGSLSDGEEGIIPVLQNRMLVTETLAMPVRGGKKTFSFDKLLSSNSSKTLRHHALTFEFTANPIWYAVQALPYLSEVKDENAEQVFNRFYANAIAWQIANRAPRLKQIIESWKKTDTSAFFSNLQKNEELKSIVLEETPWVMQAMDETKQKQNIVFLFDMIRMSGELNSSLSKLAALQVESGAFVWYPNAPEDRYMTQYILTGIGRLIKMNAIPGESASTINQISTKALHYLDQEIKRDYDRIRKDEKKVSSGPGYLQLQYLYMRSYFPGRVSGDFFPAFNFFRNEARKNWVKQDTYSKAMIALIMQRNTDKETARNIIASLTENASVSEEMGMYWKDVRAGYYWFQAPVETHSLLAEAYSEISSDSNAVDNIKTWLLKNKQTNRWTTTRATADACYALLMRGSDWLTAEPVFTITTGNKQLKPSQTQQGTGYFKTTIPGDSIKTSMGNITVSVSNNKKSQPSWGAAYWQYFEDLDKITTAGTTLSVRKQVMLQRNTPDGPALDTLANNNTLKVGDKITVRIELRSDRDLEYVHMKDLRAASFEPVNVLSGYKWKGGLGYYESTRDVASHFYFHHLPKGVHIFEYELFATQAGTFSNGITTVQCMYAPEFSSHSKGIRVNVQQP